MSDAPAALIDLGTDRRRDWSANGTAGPPLTRIRPFAVALGVALLLAAGGSAPPPPLPLVEIATVTLGPEPEYQVSGDRLFVAALDVGQPHWIVSAHELERGRPLWTARIDSAAALIPYLQPAAGLLLLTGIPRTTGLDSGTTGTTALNRTTALDAATGRIRWSVPFSVSALSDGRTGLVVDETFSADAEVKPGDPPPQGEPTYYYDASNGRTYSRPPVGFVARGVDLASGALLWTADLADIRVMDPGPARQSAALLVVTKDHRVEVWDARTRAASPVTEVSGQDRNLAVPFGDLVLVRDKGILTAYATDTLRPRWTRPISDLSWSVGGCGGVLPCALLEGDSVDMIDLGTGTTLWRRPVTETLVSAAGHLVELDGSLRLIRTLDPRTGRTLIDLRPWTWTRVGFPPDQEAPAVLARAAQPAGTTRLGLLEQGVPAVRTLDVVPHRVKDCLATASAFVCRTATSDLRVWRYK